MKCPVFVETKMHNVEFQFRFIQLQQSLKEQRAYILKGFGTIN